MFLCSQLESGLWVAVIHLKAAAYSSQRRSKNLEKEERYLQKGLLCFLLSFTIHICLNLKLESNCFVFFVCLFVLL